MRSCRAWSPSCWPRAGQHRRSGREGWPRHPTLIPVKRADPARMARAPASVLSRRLSPPKPINGLCQSTENCQNHTRGPIQIHHPGPASFPAAIPQGSSLGLSEKAFPSDSRERQSQKCILLQKKEKQTSLHPSAHFNLEMNIISPLLIANTGHCLNETICICYLIRRMFFKWGKNNPLGYKSFLWGSFLSFNLVSC